MTTTSRPELTGVAGVPETLVSEALLARLPSNDAPAPWTVHSQAVIWYARGGAAATQALPPALRAGHRGLAVVGGVVRYDETPVGPYDEVFGLVGSRDRPPGFRHGRVHVGRLRGQHRRRTRRTGACRRRSARSTGEIGHRRTMTARGADAVRLAGHGDAAGDRARGCRCR